ncbi:cell division protein ZapE [Entomomonas sp. E2T0]|uniref:cell division protein ZapE n=1 Tax=Entomomonas sp. E2T0 TaxID=2930213 RepID=UPI0022281EFB|nr:cell division protein ZapE [Entomomonas sp. E2T0]UYZ84425.1 cell division protein ZapE [Entomomonas sp. E2T0]
MTPLERYQADLKRPDFAKDSAQENAVNHLQRLFDDLVAAHNKSTSLVSKLFHKRKPIKGLYFWGGVGRGKTYLMDIFYDTLPFPEKMRTHFHRFMKRVHEDLTQLKGHKNPLTLIAERISKETRVICFDEFFVSDIADAMILGTLFEEIFKRGVSLVATSNIIPDGLYKDGLQRARFLPAIALLKENTEVINVDSGIDYRLRVLEKANLYYCPNDAEAEKQLEHTFANLILDPADAKENIDLTIENRLIHAKKACSTAVWFEFRDICDGPRSQNDYIDIAKAYKAVLISNVEQLDTNKEDIATRFIYLVDEFYDRNVKLILSAEVPLKDLYVGIRSEFAFQRTLSRLLEMQSHEFLTRPHKN